MFFINLNSDYLCLLFTEVFCFVFPCRVIIQLYFNLMNLNVRLDPVLFSVINGWSIVQHSSYEIDNIGGYVVVCRGQSWAIFLKGLVYISKNHLHSVIYFFQLCTSISQKFSKNL